MHTPNAFKTAILAKGKPLWTTELSPDSRERLNRYRGFRHVVRNVYTFQLDEQQVRLLVESLRPTFVQVNGELLAFATFLEELAAN